MKILILNGPNLNLTGERETKLYGTLAFEDYIEELRRRFPSLDIAYDQSNIEGEIIDKMQDANFEYDAIILNPGGYTHTSVAIGDTVKAIEIPVVEVICRIFLTVRVFAMLVISLLIVLEVFLALVSALIDLHLNILISKIC